MLRWKFRRWVWGSLSLRETLVKPKDKLEKEEKVGVVYHQPCAGIDHQPCPDVYIGETERTAAARFQEHTSTATNALGKYKSAMLQHARDHGHHFPLEDQTILSYESDWVKRGIKEALFIRALNPAINIDPGRHQLSAHFDSILANHIKAPPPPPPHNPEIETPINTAPWRQGRPRRENSNPHPASSQSASQPIQPRMEQSQSQPQQQQHSQPHRPLPQRQSQRIRDRLIQSQQWQLIAAHGGTLSSHSTQSLSLLSSANPQFVSLSLSLLPYVYFLPLLSCFVSFLFLCHLMKNSDLFENLWK